VRYNLTLTVDEISFADGMLNMTNTAVTAIGRGRELDRHGDTLTMLV
jgi:hypothetical protein